MADISVEKKSGDFTWIWAAAAILAIIGLMGWLFSTQDTARTAGPGATGADTATAVAAVDTVDLAEVNPAPDQFQGRPVYIEDASVAAVLGDRAFWIDVPGQNPFFVALSQEAGSAAWIAAGATADLQGTIQPVSEAELNRLVSEGALHPDAVSQASFVSHYLLADAVHR